MPPDLPCQLDEATGIVHARFTRMEYRGGSVTSDLRPKLTPYEDRHYEVYQRVGNEAFAELLQEMHSNLRQFFPREEVRARETYLWFEGGVLVGSVRMNHVSELGCHEIERLLVAPRCQGRGHGTRLLEFAVAELQRRDRAPIFLTVAACNEKAIRMYERFGFVAVGETMEEWTLE